MRWIVFFAAFFLLSGCAVHKNSFGNFVVDIDEAEILGTQLASFTLADGGSGSLRAYNNQHTIKLNRYLKVVKIPSAKQVRLISVEHIEGSTNLLIQAQVGSCSKRHYLYSINGSQVGYWELGGCSDDPRVGRDGTAQFIDLPDGRQMLRRTYRNGELYKRQVSVAESMQTTAVVSALVSPLPTSTNAASLPTSTNAAPLPQAKSSTRYLPSPPIQVAQSSTNKRPILVTTERSAPASSSRPPTQPQTRRSPLVFEEKPQQKVVIALE